MNPPKKAVRKKSEPKMTQSKHIDEKELEYSLDSWNAPFMSPVSVQGCFSRIIGETDIMLDHVAGANFISSQLLGNIEQNHFMSKYLTLGFHRFPDVLQGTQTLCVEVQ